MSPANSIFSSYFRIGNPGALTVFVKASVPGGTSMLKITINGTPFNVTAAGTANTTYTVGTATGSNQQRMDFAGGVSGGKFYLQNGGLFCQSCYAEPTIYHNSFWDSANG